MNAFGKETSNRPQKKRTKHMSVFFRYCLLHVRPRLQRGLEEFYDNVTKPGEKPFTGRAWTASELRLKSFSDLHKLWYILLKEKNMLLTQRALARQKKDKSLFPQPIRLVYVKKSMARLKTVLRERELVVKAAKKKILELYLKEKKKVEKLARQEAEKPVIKPENVNALDK